jgi:hypothetical protein
MQPAVQAGQLLLLEAAASNSMFQLMQYIFSR